MSPPSPPPIGRGGGINRRRCPPCGGQTCLPSSPHPSSCYSRGAPSPRKRWAEVAPPIPPWGRLTHPSKSSVSRIADTRPRRRDIFSVLTHVHPNNPFPNGTRRCHSSFPTGNTFSILTSVHPSDPFPFGTSGCYSTFPFGTSSCPSPFPNGTRHWEPRARVRTRGYPRLGAETISRARGDQHCSSGRSVRCQGGISRRTPSRGDHSPPRGGALDTVPDPTVLVFPSKAAASLPSM